MAASIGTVYAVDEVRLTLLKSAPPSLVVNARGRTTSSGWSGGQLSRYMYVAPPADGIQEFDFVATPPPPDMIVLPVLSPILAEYTFADFDQANFWGPGTPLAGIRVHAATNAKTALFEARRGMPPSATIEPDKTQPLSFERDIKPLFRPDDVVSMSGRFNLHSHTDVVAHSDGILERLTETNPFLVMPCDGAWPPADIEKFRKWIDDGKLP